MTDLDKLENSRSLALQKIGRNVLNFQRMEAMLKYLVAHSEISGPIHQLADIRKRNVGRLRKQPMGRLAESFVRSIYLAQTAIDSESALNQKGAASFSFSIDVDQAYVKARKNALSSIVASRNKLIHEWLADFNPNSIESCDKLSKSLDEQRDMIRDEYEILRTVVLTFRTSLREIGKYLETGEYDGIGGEVPIDS